MSDCHSGAVAMNYAPKAYYRDAALPGPVDAQAVVCAQGDDPLTIRTKILHLQESMLADEMHVECPVTHTFAPGVYAREMLIPKGTVIVGKIHKHAHVNIISKGKASVMTEFGPMQIEAPHTFVSQPGTKRVVVALEDVIWTTIHPTMETDLEKIEDEVIAKSYDEIGLIDSPAKTLQIEGESL